MRLSTVFELLVIALLIAFAASRVIDGPDRSKSLSVDHRFAVRKDRQTPPVPVQEPPNRYCSCSSLTCNCCREFKLPVVPIKGPGCATVAYLREDTMMITMSFGDRVLRNITVNSKKPKPICMNMPGGISKFCGKLYSIKRDGEHFKACLALELRALDDVEAALRVSCFKFGPGGVNVEPGEAVPGEKNKEDEDEDDDDDYGFGELDDDDDDDDDDFGLTGGEDDDDEEDRPPAKDTSYNDVDSSDSDSDDDYTGLSSLSEELFGGLFGSSGGNRRPGIDDDDDNEDEDDVPEPQKAQISSQPQQNPSQVNLVVMQPVIIPAQTVKPALQRRPVKKPTKNNSTSPTSIKRVRPTTAVPVDKVKSTVSPSKIPSSSVSPVPDSSVPSTSPPTKKKKNPVRTRKPTPKPSSSVSTEVTPTVITATTITVNVLQGETNLNETMPHNTQKPDKDVLLKVPMSKPVVESKPIENVEISEINTGTERVITDANESTTQTIMQNTIPTGDTFEDDMYLEKVPLKRPIDYHSNVFTDDIKQMSTTPKIESISDESMTYGTTIQESGSPSMITRYSETFTTSINNEMTENVEDHTLRLEPMTVTQAMDPVTMVYEKLEEGTDKTEAITDNVNKQQNDDSASNYESESDDEDEEDDIDIGADLGLEDEEEEDEEEDSSKENPTTTINLKPEEKDDEDDDILGGLLEEDEESESKTNEKEEDRTFKNAPYQINPLLYRLARISSGSVATARHLPRFSEGRNRRNNKRMRFPTLEITP